MYVLYCIHSAHSKIHGGIIFMCRLGDTDTWQS